jgi:signal transduction histidine kinase
MGFARRCEARERARVDVNKLVGAFEPILHRLTNSQLDCHLAPEPSLVYADSHQLEQVLLNLVMNAHDALPVGEGTITLSTRTAMANLRLAQERCVCIVVEDDGCGIAPDT